MKERLSHSVRISNMSCNREPEAFVEVEKCRAQLSRGKKFSNSIHAFFSLFLSAK